MSIFQQIVNKKINSITVEELLSYSQQYQINISRPQATQIVKMLRGTNINIFDDKERQKLIRGVAKITSPAIARELNTLFTKFTN